MKTNQEAAAQDHIFPNYPCTITIDSPSKAFAVVTIPQQSVDALYHEASCIQQHNTEAQGFKKGNIPLAYIQETYRANLLEHLEEFFLNYSAIDTLHREIREQKLILTGNPQLVAMNVALKQDATFTFEISLCPSPDLSEWKYLPFKAPKRKNYKDLDRQVNDFIQSELKAQETNPSSAADNGDWVHFSITLVNNEKQPLFAEQAPSVWIRIGEEEADSDFRELLFGLTTGTTMYSKNKALQEYFGDLLSIDYLFKVTILDVLKNSSFCFDSLKKQFRLKTNKDLHRKLIEVFSFRNDVSQRRAMADEALRLILSRHRFSLPESAQAHQEEALVERIKQSPDYHVYRNQSDFKIRLSQLAEKQACELILLDQIAYTENIKITDADIRYYLNLTNRPRMKDFIYFDIPITKVGGQETPLSNEILKTECLREKALNYVVYYLTRE
jgi:FKBP-type peptidyl-prolyl cis-trans isomerase (trigger factor)